MLAPLTGSRWRALVLVTPGLLAIACQSTDRQTPAARRVPDAPAMGFSNRSPAPPGSEATDWPIAHDADVRPPRKEPFDRELLPPPSIGGWTPMEAETLFFPQTPGAARQDPALSQEPEHWSGLPLMSELARDQGIKLPEPLGLGIIYSGINRPSKVDKVRAGVNGGDLVELPSLDFEAEARVEILIGRLDAWILPMLNVYVLGGYVWNESTVDVTVDLPGAPNTTFVADGNLEGPTYGVGATFASGYARYFMLADFNWNKVELGGLSEMNAMLATARVGWRNQDLEWADELRVYLATTYWDTARTISGSLAVNSGPISTLEYAVDQSPVDSWTIGAGAHLGLDRHSGILLEAQGYDETLYIVAGFTYRF